MNRRGFMGAILAAAVSPSMVMANEPMPWPVWDLRYSWNENIRDNTWYSMQGMDGWYKGSTLNAAIQGKLGKEIWRRKDGQELFDLLLCRNRKEIVDHTV